MNRMVHSPIARFVIWWTTACVLYLSMPSAAVWAAPPAKRPISHRAPRGGTRDQRLETMEPVRVLSAQEMKALRGAGQYRNAGLAGTRPWQRTFRDVNLCTGNLMKSFTDIQVAGTRGPGLAWQRTYNSQIEKEGPFGTGWQSAYDLRIEESDGMNVPQTGFLGTQHMYTRDADGLYSPPVYSTMRMESEYVLKFMETGDASMLPNSDTQTSEDGTTMHYVSEGTLANGDPRATRICDYIEDRFGNRTTLTYDLTITPADGGTKKLLTRVTDPVGRYLNVTWVNRGTAEAPIMRISQVAGPYDGGNPVYTVSYEYNAENNLWKVHQDPAGLNRTTTFEYTACDGESGLISRITDPAGRSMDYAYTRLTSPTYPDPTPSFTNTVWVCDITEPGPTGNRLQWHIETGVLGWLSMDGFGTKVATTVAPGQPMEFDFKTDDDLRTWGMQWNSSFPLLGFEGCVYWYDQENNVTRVGKSVCAGYTEGEGGDRLGLWTNTGMTYDLAGRMLTQGLDDYANTTTEFEYWGKEKNWQKKKQTDPPMPNGQRPVTQWDYATDSDSNPGRRCQLISVTDPETGSFTYDYNQYGQKISETTANNVTTTYTYSSNYWENLTQVVQDPGGQARTTSMTYDIAGRVLTSTDPKAQTSAFTYNALSQPLTAAFANETTTYTYTADGQPQTVTDSRGTTTMAYEVDTGRVQSVTDPVTGTVSYEYDRMGNRRFVTLPGGARTEYQYAWDGFPALHIVGNPDRLDDCRPGIVKVIDDEGREVEYEPDWQGQSQHIRLNQGYDNYDNLCQYGQVEYSYDRNPAIWGPCQTGSASRGLLQRVRTTWNWREQDEMGQWVWKSRVLSQNDYTYSNAGQRLTNTITDDQGNTRTEQYAYDKLSRLTGVDYGDGEVQSYTFDPMGNRLTKVVNGISEGYTYNNANMLLTRGTATYTNDENGNTLTDGAANRTMTWDSQNRMASCTFNGTTSTFTYGSDGLRRRMVTGANTTDYLLDGQNVVREIKNGVVNATYLNGPRGPEYKRDQNGAVAWYLYDGLGSVVGLVDESGNVTNSRKYDVYGAPRNAQAGSAHCFVGGLGHTSDAETGLIYMRARYMDPAAGRFVSQDPQGHGENWYAYASNSPVSMFDATGREGTSAEQGTAGAVSTTLEEGAGGSGAVAAGSWAKDKIRNMFLSGVNCAVFAAFQSLVNQWQATGSIDALKTLEAALEGFLVGAAVAALPEPYGSAAGTFLAKGGGGSQWTMMLMMADVAMAAGIVF